MKSYEIMTIIKSSLGDEGAQKASASLREFISSLDGKVNEVISWGKRKLAYEIKAEKDAYYEVTKFDLDKAQLAKLKEKLVRVDGLLRYLITSA